MGLEGKERGRTEMKSGADVTCSWKKALQIWADEEWRDEERNEEEESELEGVCLRVRVNMRMCGSGGLWQGDGLPVLCHAFSNQPTATTWGWRESEREKQRKAV